MKVNGDIFVCKGYHFSLCLWFCYWILGLLRQCGIFVFHIIYTSHTLLFYLPRTICPCDILSWAHSLMWNHWTNFSKTGTAYGKSGRFNSVLVFDWIKCIVHQENAKFYTDISCLGGVFAKNTSRETKNFPSRMWREI